LKIVFEEMRNGSESVVEQKYNKVV